MHFGIFSTIFVIFLFLVFSFVFTQSITASYFYLRSKDKILGMQALLNSFPAIILATYLISIWLVTSGTLLWGRNTSVVFAILIAVSMVSTECCYVIYLLSLMPLSKKGYRRGVVICIGVSVLLFGNIMLVIAATQGFTAQVFLFMISYFLPITMFLVVVCGIVGFSLAHKVSDLNKRHHLRQFSTICIVFLPFIILDITVARTSIVVFTFAGFLGGSVLSFMYFSNYFYVNYNSDVEYSAAEAFYAQHNISQRERDVVELLLQGLSNPEIAKALFLSENTIKTHVRNIYKKLKINNRYQLINSMKTRK
ncbi:MAG: response regulator transcription factor [Eubacteriales bacterium]